MRRHVMVGMAVTVMALAGACGSEAPEAQLIRDSVPVLSDFSEEGLEQLADHTCEDVGQATDAQDMASRIEAATATIDGEQLTGDEFAALARHSVTWRCPDIEDLLPSSG